MFGDYRDKSEDDIIRDSQDSMEVDYEFRYKNSRYRIIRKKQRTKTATVQFFIDGREQSAIKNVRANNDLIEQSLGFNAEIFNAITFFRQGKGREF